MATNPNALDGRLQRTARLTDEIRKMTARIRAAAKSHDARLIAQLADENGQLLRKCNLLIEELEAERRKASAAERNRNGKLLTKVRAS